MAELETATYVSFPVYFPHKVHLSFYLLIFCLYYFLKVEIITCLDFHVFSYKLFFFFFLVDYQTILQESQTITATCLHMKNLFLLSLFQVHLGVVHVVEIF